MPQKRDAYALAHKGLRNILFTCSTRIGATDFTDATARDETLELIDWTFRFFDLHMDMEENDYHPILESVEVELSEQAHEEHEGDEAFHAAIRSGIEAIKTVEKDKLVDAGWALYHAFNQWVAHYLLHIDHEDRVLEPRFFEVVDDAKMAALRAKVMAKLAPPDMKRWMGFFLPALSNPENAALLGSIKANAPAPAYEGMAAGARAVLGDRWAAIEAAIG
jgi:hypothetical protein